MVTTKLARQSRNTKNAKQHKHTTEDFGTHDLAFVLVRAQMQMRKRNAQKRKSHTESRELRARQPRHATSRLLKRKLAQRDAENRAPCVRVAEFGRVGRDVLRNGLGKPIKDAGSALATGVTLASGAAVAPPRAGATIDAMPRVHFREGDG